jgi:predicted CopG family antitoxin
MSKTIRVSEEFHELVRAHNREGETMEETLRRLTRGPNPEVLADIVSGGDEQAAAEMREVIEDMREKGRKRRERLQERFE